MKIVALMTVRNEERYLKRCLEHLHREGIEVCLIDNGSTDKTVEIAETFLDKNVIRIEHIPYNGSFALKPILENEERLAGEIDADWFLHHDADEIRLAPAQYKSLKEAIKDVDKQGYNAINFDEYVFLPTVEEPDHENKDYVETMRHYYYFEPKPLRRINAWKSFGQKVDVVGSGGHEINFEGRKIFPESFILRHHIVLSKGHAISKFCGRVYSEKEVDEDNWHGLRAKSHPDDFVMPKQAELKVLNDTFDKSLDKSDVWKKHFFAPQFSKREKRNFTSKMREWAKVFQPGSKEDSRAKIPESDLPLPAPFIVGVGRSGSTLLRLMFDAHPEMAIPSETHFIPELISQSSKKRNNKKHFSKTVTGHNQWPDFHISDEVFNQRLEAIEDFSCTEGLRAFYQLYAEKFDKKRWGDKTPPYDHYMLDISSLLPEARFIHIIRDGRDVAISRKGKWFTPENDIESLANYWVWRIRDTRKQGQHLKNYVEVRFEDLVNDTENELRKLCDFMELDYSPQMLQYHQYADQRLSELENRYSPDGSISLSKEKRLELFELTNKPPVKDRVQAWQGEMSAEDRSKFEAIAGDLLRDFGY